MKTYVQGHRNVTSDHVDVFMLTVEATEGRSVHNNVQNGVNCIKHMVFHSKRYDPSSPQQPPLEHNVKSL